MSWLERWRADVEAARGVGSALNELLEDAAAEIERLRAENAALRAILEQERRARAREG